VLGELHRDRGRAGQREIARERQRTGGRAGRDFGRKSRLDRWGLRIELEFAERDTAAVECAVAGDPSATNKQAEHTASG